MFPYVDQWGLHCACGRNNLEVYVLHMGMLHTLQIRCLNHPQSGNQVCGINKLRAILQKSCIKKDPEHDGQFIIDTALEAQLCAIVRNQLINSFDEEISNNPDLKTSATNLIDKVLS